MEEEKGREQEKVEDGGWNKAESRDVCRPEIETEISNLSSFDYRN